jgi:hypothetical protein
MSNNQVVIATLIEKRDLLLAAQKKIHDEYQKSIDEIEDALDILAGKAVWRASDATTYDDESPNAITGTEDGI